jgi:catechol 2,3-dioxygenase-like lactoylglutathione lyase family enzyme
MSETVAMPAPVFDHVALNVRDVAASRAFYEAALAPLALTVTMDAPSVPVAGFGREGKSSFMVRTVGDPSGPVHVAFAAADHATVDAFHAAALAAGGIDNGGPGIRENYHPNYYAAFAFDPDGNNVEAVCQAPQA